jgi:hypothetical protein
VLLLQVLHWLVRQLLSAGTTAQAEQLLGQYCISRRNPLSTVAAMKEAIIEVGSQLAHVNKHSVRIMRMRCARGSETA